MRAQPTTPRGVVDAVVALIGAAPRRVRVAIDGAQAADPQGLADQVVEALSPRPALHVRADRFWRPASLRLEDGRENPDAWLETWLDEGALVREVLDPFAANGIALPALRDPHTDRSLRVQPVQLAADGVVVVSGSVLLGRGLPVDICIHMRLSPAALARRTPADQVWTLVALARYEAERDPMAAADLVILSDDPRHPAILLRGEPDS
jgi:hypothetical protein